jgi:hypothetical protein
MKHESTMFQFQSICAVLAIEFYDAIIELRSRRWTCLHLAGAAGRTHTGMVHDEKYSVS